jgi:hypothetical protein
MNHGHFQALYNGLSSIAQRIYDTVPISETWTRNKIMTELGRNGSCPDHRTVTAILHLLDEQGLIRANFHSDGFMRVPVRAKPGPKPKQQEEEVLKAPLPFPSGSKEQTKAPLEQLMTLGKQVRALADQIDNVVLVVMEDVENTRQESDKLRQLHQLLKELG